MDAQELADAVAALAAMDAGARVRAVPPLIDACKALSGTLARVRADALREMTASMTQAAAAERTGLGGQPQVARILREFPAK